MIVYVSAMFVEIIFSAGLSKQASVSDEENTITLKTHTTKILTEPIYEEKIIYKDVRGTVYHAVEEQCDDTPLITADNSFIDTTRVNELRWIAVSRDLINFQSKRHNFTGKLKMGDTVWITYDRKAVLAQVKTGKVSERFIINKYDKVVGWWVVKDTMGEYCWVPQKKDSITIAHATQYPSEYKFEKGVYYKKWHQRNWVDFLQDPKTGMLHHWDKCLIITKRKVVGHKPIPIASLNE